MLSWQQAVELKHSIADFLSKWFGGQSQDIWKPWLSLSTFSSVLFSIVISFEALNEFRMKMCFVGKQEPFLICRTHMHTCHVKLHWQDSARSLLCHSKMKCIPVFLDQTEWRCAIGKRSAGDIATHSQEITPGLNIHNTIKAAFY